MTAWGREVVGMRDPVMLDWMAPAAEWQQFRAHVREQFGSIDGYLGREAELAMREYADADGYAGVEETVNRLVRAAGRTPRESVKEKNSLTEQETTRVTARVDADIKDEFKAAVKERDGESYGVEFGRALREYVGGGRAGRLERKLDRIVEDAEGLLAELPESNTDEGKTLSVKERKIATICSRLGEQFTAEELEAEIHDVAGRGPRASKPTLEEYRDLVIERLGVEPHPLAEKNPAAGKKRVWVPSHEAAEMAPEGMPRECRLPADLLTPEEQIRRIKLVAGRRAGKHSTGSARVSSDQVKDEILEDEVSQSRALDLMEEAALADGFELDRNRAVASLKVDLRAVGDATPELFEEIIAYRDGASEDIITETTETTMTDFTTLPSGPAQGAESAATGAVTDGGGPSRDQDPETKEGDSS